MTQPRALPKTAASAWGEACLIRCRTSSHHYGSAIWYAPPGTKDAKKDMAGKLEVIPNRYLRLLSGAYKATSIEVLQAEP